VASKNTAKKNTARKKTANKKTKGSGFKLELGIKGGLYLLLFVFLAMIWSFILGVFIGRGYNPEDYVPELARVMPGEERKARESSKSSDTLQAEDLDFLQRLTGPESEEKKQKTKKTRSKPAAKPKETLSDPKRESTGEKYEFLYQVAAFRDMEKADALQSKLMQSGITASITKVFKGSQHWYRVLVSFRGTESQAKTVKNKLDELGINEPLLKSKKPSSG